MQNNGISFFPARFPTRALSWLVASFLLQGVVQAQSINDPVDLDRVEVSGVRASIQKSLVEKRNALGIVDAISAEDMGKFPDLNLSESLQRIPGITLDRNYNGEGHGINLRGLGPELTRVEINGMTGMSNGSGGRFNTSSGGRGFNFEIFASELFSRASVYKTGLAEVDEGGLAGTVRLETPRPFDSEGTRVTASILGNDSELARHTDPRAAVLFSHNHDDIFAVALSVAASQGNFVSNTLEAGSWRPFAFANNGAAIGASDEVRAAWNAYGPRYFALGEDRDAIGSTLTLQFRPNAQMTLTLDGMYGKLENSLYIMRDDMPIEGLSNAPTKAVIENGAIIAGDFTNVQQRVAGDWDTTDENYRQVVASLDWTPNENWHIRPLVGHVKRRTRRTGDFYSFRLADADGNYDPGTVSYRLRGDFIDFRSTHTNWDSRPEDFLFNVFFFGHTLNDDSEDQARIDVKHYFANSEHVLKFGLRYTDHRWDRSGSSQELNLADNTPEGRLAVPNLSAVYNNVRYKVSGAAAHVPSRILGVDRGRVGPVFLPGGNPAPGLVFYNSLGSAARQTYTIEEKTGSAWMQMDLVFGQWSVVPGLRYLRTQQKTRGFTVENQDQPSERITPVGFAKTYHGILPSLTTRYDMTEEVVFRGAYARTLTRPNPVSLAPSETVSGIDASGGRGSRGNPNLAPYYAHNLDVGADWYFSREGLLSVNLFYKKISDFIDTRTFTEIRTYRNQADNGNLVTAPVDFSEPANGVSAGIKGAELSMQTRFSRLPGFWRDFGGIFNYSHTDSSADFGANTGGDVRNQGLPGLSKNSINAVLYYDNGRLDARLAYAWRERYLAVFAEDFNIPRFTDDYAQLDLSVNYNINRHVSLQAQVINLTKEQRVDLSSARYLPYGVAELDRRYLLGIRVMF